MSEPATSRLVKYRIFAGLKIQNRAAPKILRELQSAGCGPNDSGPFTIGQAAIVLDIQPRLVRRYCQQRRLIGHREGGRYVVTREELLRFGAKPRHVGQPGQWAMREERASKKPRRKKSNAGS